MTRLKQMIMATAALTLSAGLHAAGLVGFAPPADLAVQGGQTEAVPRLGDSFADLAQGAAAPVSPPAKALPPVTALTRQTPVTPVTADAAHTPMALTATIPDAAPAPPPLPALAPVPEVATAAAPRPSAQRPQARPEPRQVPRQKPQAAPQQQGNADRNATRGENAGQETAKATAAQSRRATSQGDGGAAANAGYGRKVLAQINRTRKARAPSRGRAVVAFAISEAGTLASVKVLQSSGSPDLDQVALDHIRRAAPFPKPPAGAQRQFSFEFVGRS